MSSKFLSRATAAITPYTPGEQPKDRSYIKLNTNECPYPPSPGVERALREHDSGALRLYPDPDNTGLTARLAAEHGLSPEQTLVCGGSDEALAFAFMAFRDRGENVYFADITYGFYPVYAELFGLCATEIPLREDFLLAPEDYFGLDGMIFIANPNAPTGIALPQSAIEDILRCNPGNLVVVDEAYVDFSPGCSCVELIGKYENLLVVQTFSKSRSLAGMRLGAAFGNAGLIDGMNRIKYSFNPYNLDRVSQAVGIASLEDRAYFEQTVARVIATRERISARLCRLGFTVLPSGGNFLFARHGSLGGGELCSILRKNGILVRHFDKARIKGYIRVTIGTDSDMDALLAVLEELK